MRFFIQRKNHEVLFNYFFWDPEDAPAFPPADGVLADVFGAPDPPDPEDWPAVVLVPLASKIFVSFGFIN
jgi:hypothetical protein